MERLTNKREADIQRIEYARRIKNGYPRNIPEERFLKLAAYENTGLTPERCVELAEADKDGRLVVLPCKVGDTVFLVGEYERSMHECTVEYFCIARGETSMLNIDKSSGQNFGTDLRAVGKYCFFSREEAEAALRGAKKDG